MPVKVATTAPVAARTTVILLSAGVCPDGTQMFVPSKTGFSGKVGVLRSTVRAMEASGFNLWSFAPAKLHSSTQIFAPSKRIHLGCCKPGVKVCQVVFQRCEGEAVYAGRFRVQESL